MKQPPTIEGFDIRCPLGEGAMGEVWLAKDIALGREVAVKFIKTKDSEEETRKQRFRREARLLAAIDHPSVVPIYRTGSDPTTGLSFFSMKAELLTRAEIRRLCDETLGCAYPRMLFEGRADDSKRPLSLRDLLFGHKTLPEKSVARIGAQLADALETLHAHKPPIVHRDIKPSNILFNASGRALLSDFGLAKTLHGDERDDSSDDPSFTSASGEQAHFVGSLSYAAPEQLMAGPQLTPAMDFYSLGVVLYEALTGQRPTTLDEPSSFNPKRISKAWDPLLKKLLSRDPSQRLLPHGQLAKQLRTIESGHTLPYRPILGIGAILVLGAAAYVFLTHPSATDIQPAPELPPTSETPLAVPDATHPPTVAIPTNPPRTINALIAQTETLRGNTNGLSGPKPRTINEFLAQMRAGQKASSPSSTNEKPSSVVQPPQTIGGKVKSRSLPE